MNASPITADRTEERIDWVGSLPFLAIHLLCLLAFVVPFHWTGFFTCLALYVVRMWGITAGYHRYFAHRSYKTSRAFQFVLALVGTLSTQKGVLWWAGHHRNHHRTSDTEEDIHSPLQRGFWWSHVGWILCPKYNETPFDRIKDFARFPELRWLNRFHYVPSLLLALSLYLLGGTSLVVWGYCISTVLLWHGTFTINSLSHIFGWRRYKTTDTSRNNWLLALLTLGEGWHNNHHYHQNTANQGWFWWEVDVSYYTLKVFSWLGLVWDLKTPSEQTRLAHLSYSDMDRSLLARGTPFGSTSFARVKEAASESVEKVKEALAAAAEHLPNQNPFPAKQ